MKIQALAGYFVPLPGKGEYLHIKDAVGDVTIKFSDRISFKMSAGETVHLPFEGLEFKVSANQEIDVRTGFGQFQPSISAVTATKLDSIRDPVSVTGSVSMTGTADVSGSSVDVSGSTVAVSGTADVSGSVVTMGGPVEVKGNRSASAVGSEITITAGSSVVIPENANRSRLILQNDSEVVTKCRVTDSAALAPSGLFLIGGDGMMATEILQTTAALKIWNTSTTDAVIALFEEIV